MIDDRVQLAIAERWRERGQRTEDPFAQFFFMFAGVNSLYSLWSYLDGIDDSRDMEQVRNLLGKAGDTAPRVLGGAQGCVGYFANRRPIARMDPRWRDDPEKDGRKARQKLRSGGDAERLVALGEILYLVRSHLVRGSKADAGDDREVIEQGVDGLSPILDWAIAYTRSGLRVS